MRWQDIQEIAIRLEELHPDADNVHLRFTDLRTWIVGLPEFNDRRCPVEIAFEKVDEEIGVPEYPCHVSFTKPCL